MPKITYKVQSGDTKAKLKKKFGLKYDFEGYKSADPSKLYAGEVLNFDDSSYNIDKVQPASPVSIDTAKPALDNIQSQDPSRVGINPNPTPAPQIESQQLGNQAPQNIAVPQNPIEGVADPSEATTKLSAEQKRIEQEITDLSSKIASLPTATIEAQKKLGIFEDQKQLDLLRTNLSDVKDQLLQAQDRGTELLEEGKQRISDFAGTSGDLKQLTNADLRKNNLNQLALSRTYSRLGDAVGNFQQSINNNIEIINQREKAERTKLEFDINQRNQALNRVIEVQGNILSNQQKAKLEQVKFNNELLLQDRKIQADQKKALLTELVKDGRLSGANFANYSDMDLPDIMADIAKQSPSSASSWLTYTQEEAALNLDKEQYERWQSYNKLDKAGREATAKQEAIVSSTSQTHNLINSILDNDSGLSDSVGSWGIGRTNFSPLNKGDVNKFRADLVALSSVITLDTLKNLKASGATLGAISEKELYILQTAGTRLGLMVDEQQKVTGRSNLSEKDFKSRLREIQTASLKVNLLNDVGREAFDKYNLKNEDNQSLRDFYDAVRAGKVDLDIGASNVSEIKDYDRVSTNIGNAVATGIESGSSYNKYGLDLVLDGGKGAGVKSPFDGEVISVVNNFSNNTGAPLENGSAQNFGWGNQVKIRLKDGSEAWVNHLASVEPLRIGSRVSAGQLIGKQGNTGRTKGSTGIHVDITMQDPGKKKLSSKQVASLMNTQKLT